LYRNKINQNQNGKFKGANNEASHSFAQNANEWGTRLSNFFLSNSCFNGGKRFKLLPNCRRF
jgi:hypothetical protein